MTHNLHCSLSEVISKLVGPRSIDRLSQGTLKQISDLVEVKSGIDCKLQHHTGLHSPNIARVETAEVVSILIFRRGDGSSPSTYTGPGFTDGTPVPVAGRATATIGMPFLESSTAASRAPGLREAAPGPMTTRPLLRSVSGVLASSKALTWRRWPRRHASTKHQNPLFMSVLKSIQKVCLGPVESDVRCP